MNASKTQLVWPHLEAFCVQTLAIDADCCLLDLCAAISVEVLFQLPRSFFDIGSKVSVTE